MSKGKNSSRNSGSGLKTIALFLVIVILAGIIGGAIWIVIDTKGFKDFSRFTTSVEPAIEVADGEGNGLQSGTVYEMPRRMVYTALTAQSETASEGIMIHATVKPATAISKEVTWSVDFENPSSAWASGKVGENYIHIEPLEEVGTANVKCLSEFAERIVIKAVSVSDPSFYDTCTVDYKQALKTFGLDFREDDLNDENTVTCRFGQQTEVDLALNESERAQGGQAHFRFEYNTSTYTIGCNVETKLELRNSRSFLAARYEGFEGGSSDWLAFSSGDSMDGDPTYPNFARHFEKKQELYFGIQYFIDNLNLHYVVNGRGVYSYLPVRENISVEQFMERIAHCNAGTTDAEGRLIEGKELFDLHLTLKETYQGHEESNTEREYTSTFVFKSYKKSPVSGVTVSPGEILF